MDEVKSILSSDGLNHGSLARAREVLIRLASQDGLFPFEVFRAMDNGRTRTSSTAWPKIRTVPMRSTCHPSSMRKTAARFRTTTLHGPSSSACTAPS